MNAVAKEETEQLKPGIYVGLPMEKYLAMPAASASLLITLLDRCPRAAWHDSWMNPKRPADASTPAQSVGTLAHALLLEKSKARLEVIDPNKYPAKTTGAIPEGWTNTAIKAARDLAIAEGKIPVFPAVAEGVEGMVVEARAYLASISQSEPAIHDLFQPNGGRSEVTIVWEEDGFLFRMRPDRWGVALMGDLKTTKATAEPNRWARTQLFGMSYYVAAAFYRRGLERATGKRLPYIYLVQEQAAPYLCSLVGLDAAAQELGQRKAEEAIARWKECMSSGRWTGYPNRVVYPEPPRWQLAEEGIDQVEGIPYDIEKVGWKEARESGQKIGFDGERAPLY